MLQTGRRDLIPHALQLLPPGEKVNASNSSGKLFEVCPIEGTFVNLLVNKYVHITITNYSCMPLSNPFISFESIH